MTRRSGLIFLGAAGLVSVGMVMLGASRHRDFNRLPDKVVPEPSGHEVGMAARSAWMPPGAEMAKPRQSVVSADQTNYEWDYIPAPWQPRPESSHPKKPEMKLVAFATWHPKADDPIPFPDDWSEELKLRDPKTLELFSEERITELGIPRGFRQFSPPDAESAASTVLRLVFRDRPAHPKPSVSGTDGRNLRSYVVWSDFKDANATKDGDWLQVDSAMTVWHDTPLNLHLKYLSGPPQYGDLPRELGAQTVIGNQVRLQWVMAGAGRPFRLDTDSVSDTVDRLIVTSLPGERPSLALLRASSGIDAEQLGVLMPGGKLIWGERLDYIVADTPFVGVANPPGTEPVRLMLMPQRINAQFRIEGMPDLPNPRTIGDLFDVVLPRVTCDPNQDAVSFVTSLVRRAAQCEADYRHAGFQTGSWPEDRTFRNVTVQQLLNWYLENTPGSSVEYDEENCELTLNPERVPWTERLSEWWDEKAPSWLGGS